MHGTCVPAGATKTGSEGKPCALFDTRQLRGDDGPDGPGVDRAVGVPAHLLVDRADIEAGPAANAVKGLAGHGLAQHPGPAVVENHDVEFFGALGVSVSANSGENGLVGGDFLARP